MTPKTLQDKVNDAFDQTGPDALKAALLAIAEATEANTERIEALTLAPAPAPFAQQPAPVAQ